MFIAQITIENYFEKRQEFLQGKDDEKRFEKIVNTGILEDEKIHRRVIKEPFAVDSIQILSLNAWDKEARATVEESRNGCVIVHKLVIEKNIEGNWIVVSDGYLDTYDGFKSASYVDDLEAAQALRQYELEQIWVTNRGGASMNAVSSGNSEQLRSLLVSTAQSQIGYYEKATNHNLNNFTANKGGNGSGYTKYGQWIIGNKCAWCAAFVSWCANQAGISTSIIPKTIWVQDVNHTNYNSFYIGAGRYHARGSYVPKKGDIFLITGGDGSHVGIVASVTNNNMVIVHGNTRGPGGNDPYYHVDTEVLSIYDTRITGYGNPNYCMGNNHSYGSYSYNDTKHWHTCTVCGQYVEGIHEWICMGSYYKCRVCGKTSTNVSGPIFNNVEPVDQ